MVESETALAVQRGVGRLMRCLGFAILNEFTLATGRRADVIALGDSGAIWIVEIKFQSKIFALIRNGPSTGNCVPVLLCIPQTLDPEIIPFEAGPYRGRQLGSGNSASARRNAFFTLPGVRHSHWPSRVFPASACTVSTIRKFYLGARFAGMRCSVRRCRRFGALFQRHCGCRVHRRAGYAPSAPGPQTWGFQAAPCGCTCGDKCAIDSMAYASFAR